MQVTIVVPDTTPEQRRLPMERMGARVLVAGSVDMLMHAHAHANSHVRVRTRAASPRLGPLSIART